MKIESLRIENFRSFSDVTISFDDYTCLVGPNGAGKSTIINALNLFFREKNDTSTNLTRLVDEDFHQKNTKDPIKITITFVGLSEDAKNDLAHYYRNDKLVVSAIATFDLETNSAEPKQFGWREGVRDFANFFRAEGDRKLVPELKEIYSEILKNDKYKNFPAPGTKNAMISTLREYENKHRDECELIQSDDMFYGVSRGKNLLDSYIQWVFIPAVKDVSTEQSEDKNTALTKILARTVRSKINFDNDIQRIRKNAQDQYGKLLTSSDGILGDITKSLNIKLSEWAHPGATLTLRWSQDSEKSIRVDEPFAQIFPKEGDFEGQLPRFGHGLQRSYLLALLQELVTGDDSINPTLILGCEEPELYQHPPQTRHLSSILQKLSADNSQIIVTTHSPFFVSGQNFESVRMIRRNDGDLHSSVSSISCEEIAQEISKVTDVKMIQREGIYAKIHQTLQPALNEMFFTQKLILVEGLEDIAYITTYLNLMEKWNDYRRNGYHIVPTNGKSHILKSLIIAKRMGIPTYTVFDADADAPKEDGRLEKHRKDNKALLDFLGKSGENPLPKETVWGDNFVMWATNIGNIVKQDIGESVWREAHDTACADYGHIGGLAKNSLYICDVLSYAWNNDKISPNLKKLCEEIF